MWLWLVMVVSSAWAKGPALDPSWAQFQSVCAQNRAGSQGVLASAPLSLGQIQFMPTLALERGQSTFSFDRVLKGLNALPKETLESLQKGEFRFDSGRSLYPEDRHISGVFYRGKVFIIDGHHRAMVSTYAGAKSIPVKIIDDWSGKTEKQFFADMKRKNLSYYVGLNGEWLGPGEFCGMVNDPLILLARRLLRRIDLTYDSETGDFEILRERGAEVAIGIKINRDVPFTEQEIARLLRSHGVTWQKGDELNFELLSKFLEILLAERDGSRLNQLLLLDYPMSVAELESEKKAILKSHFKRIQCEFQISAGDQD